MINIIIWGKIPLGVMKRGEKNENKTDRYRRNYCYA